MLQIGNIYRSIKNTWNGQQDVIPLIAGYEKEGATRPYGVVDVKPTDTQYTTGKLYIQMYHAEITFWIGQSIEDAYGYGHKVYNLFNTNYKMPLLTDNARTLQIISLPMEVTPEAERDLDVSGMNIEVFKVKCVLDIYINEVRNT